MMREIAKVSVNDCETSVGACPCIYYIDVCSFFTMKMLKFPFNFKVNFLHQTSSHSCISLHPRILNVKYLLKLP